MLCRIDRVVPHKALSQTSSLVLVRVIFGRTSCHPSQAGFAKTKKFSHHTILLELLRAPLRYNQRTHAHQHAIAPPWASRIFHLFCDVSRLQPSGTVDSGNYTGFNKPGAMTKLLLRVRSAESCEYFFSLPNQVWNDWSITYKEAVASH